MIGLFGRKKIGEDQMAKIFINAMWKMTSEAFPEIAAMINEDPDFEKRPQLEANDHTSFFFIVVSGNLKYLPIRLAGSHTRFIVAKIYEYLAELYDTSSGSIEKHIKKMQSEMSRLNHPSKNTIYGMSKLFFHEYNLYGYQETYYCDILAPNPIILKRIDEIMRRFIWDWEVLSEEYRIVD